MYPRNFYYPYYMTMNTPFVNTIRPFGNGIPVMGTRTGLFSRLGNSFGAIKNINWSNIINNTSRTLGVINQAIPIVKQTGPMLHNMRSMLKVASVFKDETSNNNKNSSYQKNDATGVNVVNDEKKEASTTEDGMPNFFV